MRKRRLLVAGITAAGLIVGTPVVALAMSGSDEPAPAESNEPRQEPPRAPGATEPPPPPNSDTPRGYVEPGAPPVNSQNPTGNVPLPPAQGQPPVNSQTPPGNLEPPAPPGASNPQYAPPAQPPGPGGGVQPDHAPDYEPPTDGVPTGK